MLSFFFLKPSECCMNSLSSDTNFAIGHVCCSFDIGWFSWISSNIGWFLIACLSQQLKFTVKLSLVSSFGTLAGVTILNEMCMVRIAEGGWMVGWTPGILCMSTHLSWHWTCCLASLILASICKQIPLTAASLVPEEEQEWGTRFYLPGVPQLS